MLALYQEYYAGSGILPTNFYFLKQKWKHQDNINNKDTDTLGEKCPNTEFFLSVFFRIRVNTGKYGPEKTRYLDTFYAVERRQWYR